MYILDKVTSKREPSDTPTKYLRYLEKLLDTLVVTKIRSSAGCENKRFPKMVYKRLEQ